MQLFTVSSVSPCKFTSHCLLSGRARVFHTACSSKNILCFYSMFSMKNIQCVLSKHILSIYRRPTLFLFGVLQRGCCHFSNIIRPCFSDYLMFRLCLIYKFLTPFLCVIFKVFVINIAIVLICFCLFLLFQLAMISAGLILLFNVRMYCFYICLL